NRNSTQGPAPVRRVPPPRRDTSRQAVRPFVAQPRHRVCVDVAAVAQRIRLVRSLDLEAELAIELHRVLVVGEDGELDARTLEGNGVCSVPEYADSSANTSQTSSQSSGSARRMVIAIRGFYRPS